MAARSICPGRVLAAGALCALAGTVVRGSNGNPCSAEDCGLGATFALPATGGGHLRSGSSCQTRPSGCAVPAKATGFRANSGTSTGAGSAFAIAAVAAICHAARSRVARRAAGQRMPKYYTHERKWWSIEETEDPTTLPIWQRDFRYGFQVLKRTMVEERKKGNKAFWDVRVLEVKEKGCTVEMLNSGLLGWCPISQEGPNRLNVGDVVKMECTACPQKRVNTEKPNSPWPQEKRRFRQEPHFSHWHWLEQQSSIAHAAKLKVGEIVNGTVYKHLGRGLIIELEGENAPKGMLAMMDISRKMSSHIYVNKMFPTGTKMKCYVVHADTNNGRITLSTKEFEDDQHMGWMLSFPERCFEMAEEAVKKYHEKRSAYIKWLQR